MGGGFMTALYKIMKFFFYPRGISSSMSVSRTTSNRSMGRATSSNLSCLNLSEVKFDRKIKIVDFSLEIPKRVLSNYS